MIVRVALGHKHRGCWEVLHEDFIAISSGSGWAVRAIIRVNSCQRSSFQIILEEGCELHASRANASYSLVFGSYCEADSSNRRCATVKLDLRHVNLLLLLVYGSVWEFERSLLQLRLLCCIVRQKLCLVRVVDVLLKWPINASGRDLASFQASYYLSIANCFSSCLLRLLGLTDERIVEYVYWVFRLSQQSRVVVGLCSCANCVWSLLLMRRGWCAWYFASFYYHFLRIE